ncbi:MAG: class I SAM-dependent methyltransferase [Planctomycetota bacterium]
MTGGKAWQIFFDHHASKYDDEPFTKATEQEISFLREVLDIPDLSPSPAAGDATGNADDESERRGPEPLRILDVGCGTGRHAVPLAVLGHRVTGVDLSSGMLHKARKRAEEAGVPDDRLQFVHVDARQFEPQMDYDIAYSLCEGALCLHDASESRPDADLPLLEMIFKALRPGGRMLLTALNGCRMIRSYSDDDVAAGRFDVLTTSERSEVASLMADSADPDAASNLIERGYTPSEFRRMVAWIGFEVQAVYGGTAGAWGRRAPSLDEIELMLIASKPGPAD